MTWWGGGGVTVTVDNGSDRLRVSCAPNKASLLMTAKKLGDYNVRIDRLVPKVFQKVIFRGVDVELSGGFIRPLMGSRVCW